ncbi:BppU family phage baseplate upper protein [Bacillus thuringiensis]
MRNEMILIDLADPVCTQTIRSRQNDKNGLKLTVHLKEKGKIVALNGYVVKYEAINQWGRFIRDDAKIVEAGKGIFEYTLSSEAVSTPAEWLAYFVIEKNDIERTSTPDIRIVLRRDVKEGNIHIENYISEFDQALEMVKGHRKEIDEANKKITDLTPYIQKKVDETDTKCKGVTERIQMRVDNVSKQIDALDVVKKTGDTISGLLECKSDHAIVLGSRSYKTVIHKGAQGEVIFAPSTKEQGDTWDWSKGVTLRTDGTIKQATDTGWILMSINTANASNVEGRQVTRAKRNGDQVSVIGSLKNIKEGQVVFNIPTALRPAQQITDVVIIAGPPYSICEFNIETGGNVRIYNITTDKIIHFSINYLV